jgi:glucan phosphoethanolaminetransferase (alkaline phosphatase superfamily)
MTPKARQILYVAGVLAFAVLTLLSATRVIDGQTAASVSAALTAVLGLFGVTISGTAAYNVTKQVHNGQLDQVSPADQVVNGINAVLAQAEQAKSEVERVREAVSSAVSEVPVLGPLAQQAIDSLPKI